MIIQFFIQSQLFKQSRLFVYILCKGELKQGVKSLYPKKWKETSRQSNEVLSQVISLIYPNG